MKAAGKRRKEPRGGRAAMFPCSLWPHVSPVNRASSAVATETSSPATSLVLTLSACLPLSPPSLPLSLLVALRQAPVHQSRDPGRERRAREEPTGAGANSERAHQGAEVQVSGANSTQNRVMSSQADNVMRWKTEVLSFLAQKDLSWFLI